MKAYAYELDDGLKEIIYAESRGKAKAIAVYEDDIPFTKVKVWRVKWADEYYGKEIPDIEYFVNGWGIICSDCEGKMITADDAITIDGKAYCPYCAIEKIQSGDYKDVVLWFQSKQPKGKENIIKAIEDWIRGN